MTDMKEQIAASVRQIDELNRQVADHWSMVQKCVVEGRVDEAIALLNAYFLIQTKREQVEATLRGILHGYFSDK